MMKSIESTISKDVSINLPESIMNSIMNFKLTQEGYLIYLEFNKDFLEYLSYISLELNLINSDIKMSKDGLFTWFLYYEQIVFDPIDRVLMKVNINYETSKNRQLLFY